MVWRRRRPRVTPLGGDILLAYAVISVAARAVMLVVRGVSCKVLVTMVAVLVFVKIRMRAPARVGMLAKLGTHAGIGATTGAD